MFVLKILKKIIVMFQSDISPNQIAWGFALGAILGLVPNLLVKCVLFVVIMFFRVNLTAAFLAATLYAIAAFALDPLLDKIGYFVLADCSFLKTLWTALFNYPIVPFSHFNNTIVMGSLVLGIILIIPNGILAKKLLVYYRQNYRNKVSQWKIVKILNTVLATTTIAGKIK